MHDISEKSRKASRPVDKDKVVQYKQKYAAKNKSKILSYAAKYRSEKKAETIEALSENANSIKVWPMDNN